MADSRAARRSRVKAVHAATLRVGCCLQGCARRPDDVLDVTILALKLRLFVCAQHVEDVRLHLMSYAVGHALTRTDGTTATDDAEPVAVAGDQQADPEP